MNQFSFWIIVLYSFLSSGTSKKFMGKIIGGDEVRRNDNWNAVAILDGDEAVCGGGLISKNHVLTSAHCISKDNVYGFGIIVLVGTNNLTHGGQRINSIREVTAPGFQFDDPECMINDIGIITLEYGVKCIFEGCILKLPENLDTSTNTSAIFMGWGITKSEFSPKILQELHTVVISNKECELKTDSLLKVLPYQLCTLHSFGKGYGGCDGDCGSPLIHETEDGPVIIGIFTHGTTKCADGFPDIFIRVNRFLDFINSEMQFINENPPRKKKRFSESSLVE